MPHACFVTSCTSLLQVACENDGITSLISRPQLIIVYFSSRKWYSVTVSNSTIRITLHVHNYWHCSHSMPSRFYETIVHPSVRPSVFPIMRLQLRRAAGLLLSAVRAKDIDRQRRAPGSSSAAARGRSTALSSKCGQCHVDRRINEAEHRLVLLSILGLLKF